MSIRKILLAASAAMLLSACGGGETTTAPVKEVAAKTKATATASLDEILAAQSDKAKARYQYRNPKETLAFFGIEPGMTVVEVLPGGGWYTKILLPHLGDDGHLIGVDYPLAMWPEFGGFADEAFIEKKKTWPADWTGKADAWRAGSKAELSAFAFDNIDPALEGKADAVLFMRALHNLSRFEEAGGYLTAAMGEVHKVLKPGGIVGVVQHQAPESNSAEATNGSHGYLKKSTLVAQMKAAGFELIKSSDINANPKDTPNNEEIVWRLKPSLRGNDDNPEQKAIYEAIGESNRMTLLFKKF